MNKPLLPLLSIYLLVSCASTPSSVTKQSNLSSSSEEASFSSIATETKSETAESKETSTNETPVSKTEEAIQSSSAAEPEDNPFGSPSKPVGSDFLSLFDIASDIKITLSLSEDVSEFISDYQSSRDDSTYHSVYLPCDFALELNGEKYEMEEVGIRMKGNTSRRRFFEDGSIIDPVHFKLSFKATFDGEEFDRPILSQFKRSYTAEEKKARKDRKLFGLEKLDLKYIPRNGNESDFHEPYAYSLFRDAGLLAPYASLGKMELNCGEDSRVYDYEIVETVDKEFLKRRMGKSASQGDLYKCTYGRMGKADLARQDAVTKELDGNGYNIGSRDKEGRKIGVEDDWTLYHPSYDLKTNDSGELSDFSNMVNYINTMWDCTYAGGTKSMLESALDMSYFLRFSAATYLLGNFDDQRYNANNYYLYFLPDNGKAYYIPYDWDWCLGVDLNTDMASRKPFDNKDMSRNEEVSNNVYLATILDRSNDAVSYSKDAYKKEYRAQIDKLIGQGFLDYSSFLSYVETSPLDCCSKAKVRDYMEKKTETVNSDSSFRA